MTAINPSTTKQNEKITAYISDFFKTLDNMSKKIAQLVREKGILPTQTLWDSYLAKLPVKSFESPEKREIFISCEKKIAKSIADQYLSKVRTIEVGSGILDANGFSYLMKILPKSLRSNVEPTDICDEISSQLTFAPKKVDITNLTGEFRLKDIQQIISANLLHTFGRNLPSAVKGINQMMINGGRFIHITDLIPPFTTLLAHYVDVNSLDSTVAFPWTNEYKRFRGLQYISKDELYRFLETNQDLTVEFKKFLKDYASWDANIREGVMGFYLTDSYLHLLSYLIQDLKIPGVKTVDICDFFIKQEEAALNSAGFEIEESSYRECRVVLSPLPKHLHVLIEEAAAFGSAFRKAAKNLGKSHTDDENYRSCRQGFIDRMNKFFAAASSSESNRDRIIALKRQLPRDFSDVNNEGLLYAIDRVEKWCKKEMGFQKTVGLMNRLYPNQNDFFLSKGNLIHNKICVIASQTYFIRVNSHVLVAKKICNA